MKAYLMYKDQDFNWKQAPPSNEPALSQDLELDTLFSAMAAGDEFLYNVAKSAVLSGYQGDIDTILYRQNVLKDCLKNPLVVREIYALAFEAIEKKRKDFWGSLFRTPGSVTRNSIDTLQMFVGMLKKLRAVADTRSGDFESDGFKIFFRMLKDQLGDEYFASIEGHLRALKFRQGILISAGLGIANKGTHYVLRSPIEKVQGWLGYFFGPKTASYTIHIHPRDETGWKTFSDIEDRGLNVVANALAQSVDHILSFFKMLRTELAFYIGSLNLSEQLKKRAEPICFPEPSGRDSRRHCVTGLYDVCLALRMKQRVVGNDVNADDKSLTVVTGANKGGKSTFLRSIGLSQLMMQCGMFVPAVTFSANLCSGIFTHYKREEDSTMKSGKLDEELSRMNEIADQIKPDAIMLFNESFAATNEREGSEIATLITSALLERGIKVFFVTHLYEFAHGCFRENKERAIFLRAERQDDGGRTFRLVEKAPLETSYGEDLYNAIFADAKSASAEPTSLAECSK
jgi:DNA mismatch repair ATPase MutS